MDEDKFHIITIIGLVLILISVFMMYKALVMINNTAKEQLQCTEVIDAIYEHCAEENSISIATTATWNGISGRHVNLKYEHGVCVIK